MRTAAAIALAAVVWLCALPARAQTFRSIQPILVPDAQTKEAIRQGRQLRGAAIPGIRQVPREVVEEAVRKIYAAYNTPDFRPYLSELFYEPDRLAMAIDEKVPRQATMRLINISSVQTVAQQAAKDEQGRDTIESRVLVVVRAQLEFTNAQGFQRREGESELVLRLREKPL
jgi:hypothetical protein